MLPHHGGSFHAGLPERHRHSRIHRSMLTFLNDRRTQFNPHLRDKRGLRGEKLCRPVFGDFGQRSREFSRRRGGTLHTSLVNPHRHLCSTYSEDPRPQAPRRRERERHALIGLSPNTDTYLVLEHGKAYPLGRSREVATQPLKLRTPQSQALLTCLSTSPVFRSPCRRSRRT